MSVRTSTSVVVGTRRLHIERIRIRARVKRASVRQREQAAGQAREPDAVRQRERAGLRAQRELGAERRGRHARERRRRASATSRCARATRARACPGTARHVASTSDVPNARWIGIPSTLMKSGASRKPPLLPSRPETKPTTPTTAMTRNTVAYVGGHVRVCAARLLPRQQDAQPEREDHDVGHDHEWTARESIASATRPRRLREARSAGRARTTRSIDVAGARVDAAREPGRRESSPGAATRSRRSRERRGGAGAASRSRSRPCRTRPTRSPTPTPMRIAPTSTCAVTLRFNGPATHRSSLSEPLGTIGITYGCAEGLAMDMRQVEYVLAVVDRGSFTKAAASMQVSQPSLSDGIRRLEAELDVRLFHRLGSLGRADRRRTRLRRARPPAHPRPRSGRRVGRRCAEPAFGDARLRVAVDARRGSARPAGRAASARRTRASWCGSRLPTTSARSTRWCSTVAASSG